MRCSRKSTDTTPGLRVQDDLQKRNRTTARARFRAPIAVISKSSTIAAAMRCYRTSTCHKKLITCLIYLADQGQNSSEGTSLYGAAPRAKHPAETNATDDDKQPQHPPLSRDDFMLVQTVPYRPNTALIFAPGDNTRHGVEEVNGDETRRAIQFQINRQLDFEPTRQLYGAGANLDRGGRVDVVDPARQGGGRKLKIGDKVLVLFFGHRVDKAKNRRRLDGRRRAKYRIAFPIGGMPTVPGMRHKNADTRARRCPNRVEQGASMNTDEHLSLPHHRDLL